MSELPSREVALGILDGRYDEDAGARIVADILRLIADGRLVDRDTIDYEAEARKVHALVRSAYNQFPVDGERKPWDALDEISRVGLIAMARNRIDAAIGDTEDE